MSVRKKDSIVSSSQYPIVCNAANLTTPRWTVPQQCLDQLVTVGK